MADQSKGLADHLKSEPTQLLISGNRADLACVHGIGSGFSQMLVEAGVDSSKELAVRNADNLPATLGALTAKQQGDK